MYTMNALRSQIIIRGNTAAAQRRCTTRRSLVTERRFHTNISWHNRFLHKKDVGCNSELTSVVSLPCAKREFGDAHLPCVILQKGSPSRIQSISRPTTLPWPTTSLIRSFSNVTNNDKNAKSTSSTPLEPKFQDTELPLYSFLSDNTNNINDYENKQQPQSPPPPISKVLSILYPESKLLLLALGALTVSTAATMQFPNAIGQMIDILSSAGDIPIIEVGCDVSNGIESISPIDFQSTEATPLENNTAIPADDNKASPQLQQEMESIALRIGACFTVGALATFGHSAMFDTIGQKIGASLRKKLFTKLIHEDISFFDKNRGGELANRLSTDVHEVAEHSVQSIHWFLSNLVRALTATGQMVLISPMLTMYLSPLPILLGGSAAFFGKHIKHWSKQHLDMLAQSTHIATEKFGAIRNVVSFGQRQSEQRRYSHVIEASYIFARRVAVFQGAFLGSSYFVGNGLLLGVLIVGAGEVHSGSMSAGMLAGFCMYAGHLADSTIELSQATGLFLKAQGSGARLFSLLDRKQPSLVPLQDGTTDMPIARTLPQTYNANIRFEDIQFAYPSHPDVSILNEVSFTLSDGEMLAVTGASGSGKSSIISLLLRFYEPSSSGRITLGGRDICDLDVEWLRSQIGLVGQEPILFHASVSENVAYGNPKASHDEVVEACIAANAHRFILELPEQYDTIVGERGASISGGQKQRLCIARALLTKPRILALDEASSALDPASEQELLQHLRLLLESKDNNLSAVLFITHKRSVWKQCDRLAVLKDGRIAEAEVINK